jgi:pilus assembly protein CpaB
VFLTPAKVTVGMLGVVGLLTGGYVAKTMLAREEVAPQASTKTVPMAVADIPAGTLITAAHLGNGTIEEARLAEHRDIALNAAVLVNRVAKEPISNSTPIRTSQLYGPGEFPSLAVQPGMRAVSLEMGGSTNLVSGLIKPGQFVDVHLTPSGVPDDERTGGGMTMTLFKGVKILAMNRSQTAGGVDRSGNQVTVELTPRQANEVILAKDRGELTMSYNPEATEAAPPAPANDDRATFNEILGLAPLKLDPPFITEHYRGSGRSTLPFKAGLHLDVYSAVNSRFGGPGYGATAPGYGAGYGGAGNTDFNYGIGRPAPIWWQSHSNDKGAGNGTQPGNGPAPSGMPRVYPSAQTPSAPRT